jgi:hypothetical protein
MDAPSLQNWAIQQNTLALEFPALPNSQSGRLVSGYRVQMATDDAMNKVIFSQRFASGQSIRVPTQQDGAYYLTVRAADAQGLEGRDAKIAVNVDARPQPPLLQAPKNGEKLVQGSDVTLLWAKPQGATGYIVEIQDATQKRTQYRVENTQYDMRSLAPGTYGWRIAAQMKTSADATKTGAWSEQQLFTVLAKLDAPDGKIDKNDRTLHLRWADQKVKEYEVQVSRTDGFDSVTKESVVTTYTVKKPELDIPDAAAGKHFIRYRAIEENGFISGWSGTMEADVPKDWRSLWLFFWAAITVAL